MPTPAPQRVEAAQQRAADVALVARRVAGLLILAVGLVSLGVVTFRYRHLNDLTAIVFAIGAALLALGVIAVIAVPMLELGHRFNSALVRWAGWLPGFGLVLTGITHYTDWKFYRDNDLWLSVHNKRPTLDGIQDEGSALIVLGSLLIVAALFAVYAMRRSDAAQA